MLLLTTLPALTSASLIVFGTSIFGICGTLLNSRPLLAIYCILLWPSFGAMLVVGYTSYRRATFALPSKLDQAWSQKYGDEDRTILQYAVSALGSRRVAIGSKEGFGSLDVAGIGHLNIRRRPHQCVSPAHRSQDARPGCYILSV